MGWLWYTFVVTASLFISSHTHTHKAPNGHSCCCRSGGDIRVVDGKSHARRCWDQAATKNKLLEIAELQGSSRGFLLWLATPLIRPPFVFTLTPFFERTTLIFCRIRGTYIEIDWTVMFNQPQAGPRKPQRSNMITCGHYYVHSPQSIGMSPLDPRRLSWLKNSPCILALFLTSLGNRRNCMTFPLVSTTELLNGIVEFRNLLV